MLSYLRMLACSLGLMGAVGCSDTKLPQPGPVAPAPAPVVTPDKSAPSLASQGNAESPPAAIEAPKKINGDVSPSPAKSAISSENDHQPPEASPAERIAILTHGGPLLVDIRITMGGQPHTKVFEKLVKRVLDAGDSDHDGQSTWQELVADRAYLEKEMPNAPALGSRRLKTLIERYDENRDGKIQSAEAAAWLGRNAGASAKPLAIRSTRTYRPAPGTTSQVWHWIDKDADGQLSQVEIADAPKLLLALDADDDRTLAPAEMASLRELLEAAGQRRPYVARESRHHAALHLEAELDVERLNYLLTDLYAPRQDLGPGSFPDLSAAYKALDANADGWFQADELQSIRSIEPHMRVDVAFTEPDGEKPATASIDVKTFSPEAVVAARPAADRAVISLGSSRLVFSSHALPATTDAEPNTAQKSPPYQVRLMVHDQVDALFKELDANADGRLGERELAFCSQRITERDRNGDGQLSANEFPVTMIVAFVTGEPANDNSFYDPPSPAADSVNDARPLPPWFKHADLNGDGDVSRREFLGPARQFNRLDSDKDGFIAGDETAL